jgi:hypothetical protein
LREGRIKEAEERSRALTLGSREFVAATFLVSPQPLKDKETKFRQLLGEEQEWFADFIIGEHYLKDGNKEQALNAYRESFKTLQKMQADNKPVETWLANIVQARLYELTTAGEKPELFSAGEPNE